MLDNPTYVITILALQDKKGHLYAYDYAKHGAGAELIFDQSVSVPRFEVFPYANFSSMSTYDEDLYNPVYLEVLAEITGGEYHGLSASGIAYYRFTDRNLRLVSQVDRPWIFIRNLLSLTDKDKISNLVYGALTWQMMQGFEDQESFDYYLDLLKIAPKGSHYKFSVSAQNIRWLPQYLNHHIVPIELHYSKNKDSSYYVDEAMWEQVYVWFSDKQLAMFLHLTSVYDFKTLPKHRKTKEVFDGLILLEGKENIGTLVEIMPKEILVASDPDALFEQLYPSLNYLLASSKYEPHEEDYYDAYDDNYGQEYPVFTVDWRDDEIEDIAPLLPHLTLKALPMLRTLVLSKIAPLLNRDVLKALDSQENVPANNQKIYIDVNGEEIVVSIEQGKVAAVLSTEYLSVNIVERTDLEVLADKASYDKQKNDSRKGYCFNHICDIVKKTDIA